MASERYVPTQALQQAVCGRAADVLAALKIAWQGGTPHIACPYRDHFLSSDLLWRRLAGRPGSAGAITESALLPAVVQVVFHPLDRSDEHDLREAAMSVAP
jgi:hypothetical protein